MNLYGLTTDEQNTKSKRLKLNNVNMGYMGHVLIEL